jgi:hypothetical protein
MQAVALGDHLEGARTEHEATSGAANVRNDMRGSPGLGVSEMSRDDDRDLLKPTARRGYDGGPLPPPMTPSPSKPRLLIFRLDSNDFHFDPELIIQLLNAKQHLRAATVSSHPWALDAVKG